MSAYWGDSQTLEVAMSRTRLLFGALNILALAASLAAQAPAGGAPGGQGRGTPAPPQNLQILPKDIPPAELRALMQNFAQALGVQCAYCHVAEGRGGRNDFAADEKPQKKTARLMMQMVTHINEMIEGGVGKPATDITRVTCATCHRGAAIPKVDMPAPAQQAPAPGH